MFEIFDVLRERTAEYYSQPHTLTSDPRAQARLGRLLFINFFVFLFPLIVATYHFNYGAPTWLLAIEGVIATVAVVVQLYIFWQLELRPLPTIDNADTLISLGLYEEATGAIVAKVRRAWKLVLASILPIVVLFAGPSSIIEASHAMYLMTTYDLGQQLRGSALWARRVAVLFLVIYAVLATLIPLIVFIVQRRAALN